MIKSYHRNLKGKIKIIRKPSPIRNEIKNMSDAMSQIVINLELYGAKTLCLGRIMFENMVQQQLQYCLTQPYHGSGRCIVADSWFSSVKSASKLVRQGLHSIMLVKTTHKDFPRQLLGEEPLQCGEWKAYTTNKDGVKLQACRFCNLNVKDFISTCSSVTPGLPRKTKHHGKVAQPKAAEEYLNMLQQ